MRRVHRHALRAPGGSPSPGSPPLAAATLVAWLVLFASDRALAQAPPAASETPRAAARRPNHLAGEKSPYLQQHANNPVDWYPWGEPAFARARRENKPIFLSIGYSTCHWCHVMERESFENDTIATILNAEFVSVKVDREERPDVDRLYITAARAMGLGVGWPLNLFVTPDLQPFFGGTYFPPEPIGGLPGLHQILLRVSRVWHERRPEIERSGAAVFAALDGMRAPGGAAASHEQLFRSAWQYYRSAADRDRGGFGEAPKFPTPANLGFLLRYALRHAADSVEATLAVTRQLDAMRRGGIHDQLGGGFHRYSTDREWLRPHFEKMLYDQAQLAWSYLEAFQITRRSAYAATARDILDYVARDMTSPEGAFYSAEDADSEGEEGRFYVWTPAQVESAIGEEEARLFEWRYGVGPTGNVERGASILSEAHSLAEAARHFGSSEAATVRRLADARARLLEARARRARPQRDEKVITAWNGLMISAFARGARVLGDSALAARAVRAGEFVWAHSRDARSGSLWRRWRDGQPAEAGQLDDYAYMTQACADLHGATHDPKWLERAAALADAMIARFWDASEGGFFESPAGDPYVRTRLKGAFDGAELDGNSIAALDLVTLGRLLDRADWLAKADSSLRYYARRLAEGPEAMPQMLVAMDAFDAVSRHVVIAGATRASDARRLVSEFDRRFLPYDQILLVEPGSESQKRLARLVPFAAGLTPRSGRATAYVCVGYVCRLPTSDVRAFGAQLDAVDARARGRSR